jgi:hypothetical protein
MNFYSNLYRPHDRLKVILLLIAVLVVYLPFIGNPLIFDDVPFFSGIASYADMAFSFNFRWFPYSTLGVTWVFFGEAPFAFRIQNLLLHALNTVLLLLVLRLWISLFIAEPARQSIFNWATWLGVLVFALHPLATYATGYLVQRSILMALLFNLIMHLAYFRGLLEGRKRFAVLAVAAYFLAVFSKEHSLLIPAILLPLTWVLRAKIKLAKPALLLTWLSFAAIALLVVLSAKGVIGRAYEKDAANLLDHEGLLKGMPMVHLLSMLTQAGLFFKYLGLMLIPNPAWMSIDMRETFLMDWKIWQSWIGLSAYLLYGVGAFALLIRGGRKGLMGLALLYPWCLFPVEFSSVRVQEIFVLYRPYLWLPGFILFITLLLSALPDNKMKWISVLIVMLLLPLSWNRLWVMGDNQRLWDDAVSLLHGENKLGSHRIYFNRAQAAVGHKDWEAAIKDYRKSLAINANYPEVNLMLAVALNNAKHYSEAIIELDKVIVAQPTNKNAYYTKGVVLRNLHDEAGAFLQMQHSCDLGQQMACVMVNLKKSTQPQINTNKH